ncbi:MAG: ABC transporter ATP-binding protein [Oligoflexia bacterium]|nr:ABC transporter ATP-binding protein [Oligoflexia bacterium]
MLKKIRARLNGILEESAVLRHYFWKYRRWVGVGFAALLMVDALEVVPPLLMMAAVDLALGKPVVISHTHWSPSFSGLAWTYIGVSFLQAIGRYGWRMYLIRAGVLAGRDMRGGFARHLFGLGASFFDRTPIGALMSLSTNDVEAVRNMIGAGFLTMADSLIYFMTVPVAMWMLSPKLTLIAFIPLPFLPWIIRRNEREIHQRFEKVQECFGDLSAMTQESLNGVRVLKAFSKEEVQSRRFKALGERYVRLNLKLAVVQSAFGPTLDFAMSLGMVFLLIVGGRMVISQHGSGGTEAITLGVFVAFQRYIQKMVWPMAAFGVSLGIYERAVSSSERIKKIENERTDVPEAAQTELPRGALPGGPWKAEGRIEFRNLSFRFPRSEREVLRGISLSIEPGERVAFVGTIGSGKSALLSLLPRLYLVSDGMLWIDGVDVNRWPLKELRRQVGYVGQEVFLFSESVMENIAYGLQERSLVPAQRECAVQRASELVHVHGEVSGFVSAYATRVGERGVSVSGGQKQRLTVARAIVQEPPILVLDDALSAVDVQTEARLLEGLRSRPGRNTELIAAHRISTVRDADRIVVLDHGQIVQTGAHQKLISEKDGIYWRFCQQQRFEEELVEYERGLGEGVLV